MAVTVTNDKTTLDAADAVGNWNVGGVHSQPVIDPDSNVQGTGCVEARIQNGGGVGHVMSNHGSTNFLGTNDGKHLYMWCRQSMIWATTASNGVKFRIGSGETANFGEWQVMGQDKGIASYKAWVNGCVDPVHPFNTVNGTPPALTAVSWSGLNLNWQTGNGKSLAIIDEVKLGSKLFIKGGGVSTQGTFAEVASYDETNGIGFFKSIGGVYFIASGLEWGDTGTATTYFKDSLQTLIFEDFSVSGALYLLNFVGNATGTNDFQFGTTTGTGVSQEGSGGVIFRSAGLVPFRVHAMDSNVNKVGFYGCSFIGPASLYGCPMRTFQFEDNSASSFTEDTRDANDADASDAPMMPDPQALNDATYFGHDAHTYGLNINIGQAKAGVWSLTWEYWNGSTWTALTNVTDGTNNFATTGAQTVTWTMPVDWAKTTVNGFNRYWVRARISSFTSTNATLPLLTQANMMMSGDVHAHTSNFEAVGTTFVNMGSIHVKNGALLKKCVITDSTVPATNAAVDFEGTNPSLNTVRDLTIQNCARGILLRGTGDGPHTYDFRNIQFANNTNDVRVDYPSTATIIINVLEGGDTPSVDNVNGSTVTINNTVSLSLDTVDALGSPVEGSRVLVEAASGGTLPVDASVSIARTGSTATVTHTAHGLSTGNKVVIRGADQLEYKGIKTITVTGANTYTYTVSSPLPTTPATGTITSTAVVLEGLTDSSGNITDGSFNFVSNQPISGVVRRGTNTPRYRSAPVSGTITSAGFTTTVTMVSDE